MSTGMLSIGITGIHAAQLGLQVTQHNIANASTPGFSRQYIQQSAGIPMLTGSGYFGSGATVDTVRRAYDQYLTQQTFAAQSQVSESETLAAKLGQIDNLLADPSAGLAPAVQDFFTGVQQLAANPSLVSARQSMLSSAQVLISRFNSLAGRMSELYDSVNGEIVSETQLINLYAKQIADVNTQITKAEAASDQPPNDLFDMRDQLVAELNKHIKVSTVEDSIGNFNVFIGNGQQLVVGSVVNQLVPMTSSGDPERIVIGLKGQSGNVQELPESLIQGGALGGLFRFRNESLDAAANSLGAVAASMALTFNAQHALGQDLEGLNAESTKTGFQADFFTISAPKVLATEAGATEVKASFLAPSGDPATGNFYTMLSGSDYVLRKSAAGYTLTRSADGVVFPRPPATSPAATLADLNAGIVSEGIAFDTNPANEPDSDVDYLIQPTREVARNIALNPTVAADVKRIAVAAPTTTELGKGNTGSLTVSQGVVSSGYSLDNLPQSFVYDASAAPPGYTFTLGTATVTATYAGSATPVPILTGSIPRLSGGKELVSLTFDGIRVDLSGVPADGDTFTINPNINGVSDNRNAVKLAGLQVQNTMDGGKATFQSEYASLVSRVGADTRQAKINGEAQAALLAQNEAARSAVSGVNLDEEAANLIKYQQAYQASAKALQISSTLFDTLLGIVN